MIKNFPKEELLSFLKIFIFCFVIVFLAMNLGTIKRMFNYKIVYGGEEIIQTQNEIIPREEAALIAKQDSIEIPKIQIEAPLVFIESAEKSVFSQALDKGVVHYPGSSLPGEEGQIIFLGHSAPLGWPKVKYYWVFSKLGDLVPGDKIYFYYNQQKYTYTVKEKVILNKGEDLPAHADGALVLITCWPPGVDRRRMAVIAD